MELKLDNEAMKTLVTKVIFDGMTDEYREKLVTGAIANLLNGSKTGNAVYGSDRTELQQIFYGCVENAARKLITDRLESDQDFIQKINDIMTAAVEKAFSADGGGRESMINAISGAIVAGMSKDRY
jgi:hypothetical protein